MDQPEDNGFDEIRKSLAKIDLKGFQEYIAKNGHKNYLGYLDKKLNEWKDIPLNVGITGSSGVGKSVLINTFRGLRAKDKGAAPVGVTQCTVTQTPYCHPDNPNLKLWDIPGVGTPNFPKDKYLEKIGYKNTDFFLIVSAGRFTENDIFLAKAINEVGKRFIFVRSKVDIDLLNEEDDNPELSEKEVLENIRTDIKKNLEEYGIDEKCKQIFLINCKKRNLEFEELLKYVMDNLTAEIKKKVMAFSLKCMTKKMVKDKCEVLRGRVAEAALFSVGATAVPIPGQSIKADLAILMHETKFYIQQLGIDRESLVTLAEENGTNVEDLLKQVKNLPMLIDGDLQRGTMVTFLRDFGVQGAINVGDKITDLLHTFIPFIGSLIAAPISYATTYFTLTKILDLAAEDAENVLTAAVSKKASKGN